MIIMKCNQAEKKAKELKQKPMLDKGYETFNSDSEIV